MKRGFEVKEIDLLNRLLNELDTEDKNIMKQIIVKVNVINKNIEKHSKESSERIAEIRKEDKWYARSNTIIQNHFNSVTRKIKKYLVEGKSKEARHLFDTMIEEAKFPRYKVQFDTAIKEILSKQELDFLKWEVD